ncbi:MAG: hypothetical protein DDT37_01533 [Firmicutes bacterium]|nr:hypothetical protein [candidate division NPL-UPA2 bacterium]MBT9153748.1 hypothetical protein [candidate division NPL-UPA2 bacterium]MBT9156547.1 hypothetical protein [candidate division NPL-UPA2 bacterium]
MTTDRITLHRASARRGFSVIFDELWAAYLPHIGSQAALLYCFLQYLSGGEIPNPCSKEWGDEVCQPLGMSVDESHQAWARLQEMCLLIPAAEGYALCDPNPTPQARPESERKLLVDLEKLFGRPLSMTEITLAQEFEQVYGCELVLAAAAVAVEVQARSMPYIRQVLLNWQAKGISTVDQAIEDTAEFRREKARRHARRGGQTKRAASPVQTSPSASTSVTYDESEIVLRRIKRNEAEERMDGVGY